jgi:hypothetical protein
MRSRTFAHSRTAERRTDEATFPAGASLGGGASHEPAHRPVRDYSNKARSRDGDEGDTESANRDNRCQIVLSATSRAGPIEPTTSWARAGRRCSRVHVEVNLWVNLDRSIQRAWR